MRGFLYALIGLCMVLTSGIALSDSDKRSYDAEASSQPSQRHHGDGDSDSDDRKKPKKGLNRRAERELIAAGVTKYVGEFTPAVSFPVGDGWVKHTFDPDNGDGPICIAGTPYSVFTRIRNPSRVLIMLQGGGACWDGFYQCNVLAEAQEPPAPQVGIWDDVSGLNPVDDWSVVYLPYCDGSVFSGDNDVFDPDFGAAIGVPEAVVRFHRGMRNLTAGMDVAKSMFPNAARVMVAGSSAGGVGAAGFAPFLARMSFGNNRKLTVFNDAGPIAVNLTETVSIQARADDWQFGQFYPASCTNCSDMGQGTEIVKWRLANDSTIREAFYSTDFDQTNRFFMGLLNDPLAYRNLVIREHGEIHDLFPSRYKRFIQANKISHTALQTPDFYTSADGVPLYQWLKKFLKNKRGWDDIVEELPDL
ncbi:MAG: pectin acetylesterase-family hydrolase [Woeseia sp.]